MINYLFITQLTYLCIRRRRRRMLGTAFAHAPHRKSSPSHFRHRRSATSSSCSLELALGHLATNGHRFPRRSPRVVARLAPHLRPIAFREPNLKFASVRDRCDASVSSPGCRRRASIPRHATTRVARTENPEESLPIPTTVNITRNRDTGRNTGCSEMLRRKNVKYFHAIVLYLTQRLKIIYLSKLKKIYK